MIDELTVENYRLFEEFHIQGLTRVNLLVGANNSGKSSLLEAVYLLINQNSTALFQILEMRGEIAFDTALEDDRWPQENYQILHLFNGRDLSATPEIKLSSAKDSLSISHAKRNGRTSEGPVSKRDGDFLLKIKYGDRRTEEIGMEQEGLLERRGRTLRYSLRSTTRNKIFVTTSHFSDDELAILWDRVQLTPKENQILQALQILEPGLERLSFTSYPRAESRILLAINGYDSPIPLGSMGDGMRRILILAMSLVNCEEGTLLVDEIDTGLHHTALKKMWRVVIETAEKLNVQVFATTHSWDCIVAFQDALKEIGNFALGKVFRLERTDGDVSYVDYSGEEIVTAVEHDIEVR